MFDFAGSLSDPIKGYIYFALLIFLGEIIFYFVFGLIERWLDLSITGTPRREMFKGILERLMLAVGIAHGITTVVIAFGALKIATKLSLSASDNKIEHVQKHNDYFLIGNLLSILFAVVYALIAVSLKFVTFKI
jgi:hypothetical protein